KPMISVSAVVSEKGCSLITVPNDQVQVTVIIEITYGQAARGTRYRHRIATIASDVKEPTSCILKHQHGLKIPHRRTRSLDVVHDVPIGGKDVLMAVVVVIRECHSPPRQQQARRTDAGREARVS